MKPKDYSVDVQNDWCAGCGDHGILNALEKAFAELEIPKHQTAVFGGIGCSGKTPYYLDTNGIHTLHGRVLPFASGAKLANPELTVIAVGGDGDGLGIGAGHFANAGRRNLDITYLLFNNGVYGLTKGQAAPTLRQGEKTKGMSQASIQNHLNPIMLALTAGFTWIARGYAYDTHQLSTLIRNAISHKGSAFLEILQPCPVYNDLHDKQWYEQCETTNLPRIYSLQDEGYDPLVARDAVKTLRAQKIAECVMKAQEWDERIPSGLFYHDPDRAELTQQIGLQQSYYPERPPATQPAINKNNQNLLVLQRIFTDLTI